MLARCRRKSGKTWSKLEVEETKSVAFALTEEVDFWKKQLMSSPSKVVTPPLRRSGQFYRVMIFLGEQHKNKRGRTLPLGWALVDVKEDR